MMRKSYPDITVETIVTSICRQNGSVIPLFREQIKNGGPVTVTDEKIVRYFMLIPEARKPVKIINLAKRMIALSGAKNIKVETAVLREGEKLYEEVLYSQEGTKPSFHEKIRIAEIRQYDNNKITKEIDELIAISCQFDDMATVAKMKAIVPEYKK